MEGKKTQTNESMSKEREEQLEKFDFTVNQDSGIIGHMVTGYRCAMTWPETQAMNDRDWTNWFRAETEQAMNHKPDSPYRGAFFKYKRRMSAAKATFESEANAAFAELQKEVLGLK